MAKNIEMNYLDSGGYEVLYPKNVSNISLASSELQTMLSLSEGDSVDQAFNRINNLIQLNAYGKAIVDIIVQTTSGNPIEGIPITGLSANIDGTGNLTTNSQGKASGYVSEGQITITTPKYVDLAAGSWSETFVAGHVYSHTFSLNTTSGIVDYTASTSNLQFSTNVSQVGLTVVGGGGGGGGGYYDNGGDEPKSGGGGGGGGYCTVNQNVVFSPNTIYSLIIGTGGKGYSQEGRNPAQNGTSGGASSFLNTQSLGGNGGESAHTNFGATGGSGNGQGGTGWGRSSSAGNATNGVQGAVLGYNEEGNLSVRFGGGGCGGAIYSGSGQASGGADYGANPGEDGLANTGGGGSGGWAQFGKGGNGGSGLVRIKLTLKST